MSLNNLFMKFSGFGRMVYPWRGASKEIAIRTVGEFSASYRCIPEVPVFRLDSKHHIELLCK